VRHLRRAAEALDLAAKPALVLVGGVVGTGKSTVAVELAERLDAVVIASDRVRKRLLGVASTTRLAEGWNDGAYSPQQTERTYAGVLERARPVLATGRTAILDATFTRHQHREAAARLADEFGGAAFAVEVRCAPEVARARIARRAQAGTDPSDAGPDAYAPSARAFEPLHEWPEGRSAKVYTDRGDPWQRDLADLAERIRAVQVHLNTCLWLLYFSNHCTHRRVGMLKKSAQQKYADNR
jgi:predicted kinase